jgi:hypothetical protein
MGGMKVRIASGAIVAALLFSSTASGAASISAPAAPAAAQNGWLTLSMLTPAGTLGLAGTAVEPGPPTYAPPPPPPPPTYGTVQRPPVPVIAIWLATLATAIYILTRHNHARFFFPVPNSPA